MTDLENKLKKALLTPEPIDQLRQIALEMSNGGFSRQEIYDGFLNYYKTLQDQGCEKDVDLLGDVMDMIVGWFPPYNLNIE